MDNLFKVFLSILNMSFTASFVIVAIIVMRLFLKKTPKIVSYLLWIAVGFRLVFPFSFESVLSLLPINTQPIPQDILEHAVPRINTGISAVDNAVSDIMPAIDRAVSNILPAATQSKNGNYLQLFITIGTVIWLVGVCAMLIYSGISTVMLKRKLKYAVQLVENTCNIYVASVKTPFVMGIFKPKIYIPANLAENEKEYVILHERTHIKRHDNFVKLFAYFVLCLHWFNPLVWVAFVLTSMDMEMSCDDNVLKETDRNTRKAYSQSILSLAAERQTINIYPLAFGEGDVIRRIKNVLSYKKQSKIKIAVTLILAVMLTIGLALNQVSAKNSLNNDFELATDFLANNPLIRIISENDLTTGEDNLARQDLAYFVAKLHHPYIDYTHNYFMENTSGTAYDFFGLTKETTIIDGYTDESGKWVTVLGEVDAPDYSVSVYGFSNNYCVEKGIVDSDWLSAPYASVTLEEAVKILVTALGYDNIPENVYIKTAANKEIRLLGKHAVFQFAGVSADKVLTKNDAIMLVYNFMMSDYIIAGDSSLATHTPVINTFGASVAKPTASTIIVDGEEITFDAYNIEGSNYFRLRDIAHVLNGTTKQFGGLYATDGFQPFHLTMGRPNLQMVDNGLDKPLTEIDGSLGYEMPKKGTHTVAATKGRFDGFTIFPTATATIYFEHADFWSNIEYYKKNVISPYERIEKFNISLYQINGVVYYNLRNLAEALDFSVEYDGETDIITIDTTKSYPNRTPLAEDVNAYLR